MTEASESWRVSGKEPFESQIAVSGPKEQTEKVKTAKSSISELFGFFIALQEDRMFFEILFFFFVLAHIHLLQLRPI